MKACQKLNYSIAQISNSCRQTADNGTNRISPAYEYALKHNFVKY